MESYIVSRILQARPDLRRSIFQSYPQLKRDPLCSMYIEQYNISETHYYRVSDTVYVRVDYDGGSCGRFKLIDSNSKHESFLFKQLEISHETIQSNVRYILESDEFELYDTAPDISESDISLICEVLPVESAKYDGLTDCEEKDIARAMLIRMGYLKSTDDIPEAIFSYTLDNYLFEAKVCDGLVDMFYKCIGINAYTQEVFSHERYFISIDQIRFDVSYVLHILGKDKSAILFNWYNCY